MTRTLTTNEDKLVAVSVMGVVAHPSFPGLPAEPYRLAADGTPFLLPTYGGVVYNVSVGDSAYGWLADCVHPGVSISYPSDTGNRGLNIFACVGNEALIMTGEAKGERGVVTGKSGRFSEQVIVHLPKAVRERVTVGDRLVVKSKGVGLGVAEHESVKFKSLSPELFHALNVTSDGLKLRVPVVASVPAHLLGAGAGLTSEGGSLHIQTTDKNAVSAARLDTLRLGDLVALTDYDSRYGHGYRSGAVGVAVVGQTDGPRAGYGPGLTLLMTDTGGVLEPVLTLDTNLVTLLGLEA